jgi:hypothetical protein
MLVVLRVSNSYESFTSFCLFGMTLKGCHQTSIRNLYTFLVRMHVTVVGQHDDSMQLEILYRLYKISCCTGSLAISFIQTVSYLSSFWRCGRLKNFFKRPQYLHVRHLAVTDNIDDTETMMKTK